MVWWSPKHIVECVVSFDMDLDLGPCVTVSLGDWHNWSGRFLREIRRPRISRRSFVRGERIAFRTHAAATAFLLHHPGKFRSVP